MKRRMFFLPWLFLFLQMSFLFAQESRHFYNVDSEKRIEGTIREINMEPRYRDTAPFLVLKLEEKGTKTIYNVEVSPVWFFDMDFHKGEDLEVFGSYYLSDGHTPNLIAREIRFKGEILLLRDKHGFPNWRGGQMDRKGRKRGKNIKGL
ncbi:MAG: hypothetical protein JXB23_09980 [Candidatus Aminicenantes bacterium]|nr:hypothetical protein [Candidatus Aminicenantes bacterium]